VTTPQAYTDVTIPDYTLAEAGRLLDLSKTHTRRLLDDGPLCWSTRPVRGRVVLIDGASLHAELRRRGLPVPGE